MIKVCDIILAKDVTWPKGLLESLSHESQVAISKTDTFLVTDISQTGIVELEYSRKALKQGWCYVHRDCIQSSDS